MAYVLACEVNGKKREFSTASYYEHILRKEKMRKLGVQVKESLTGAEKQTAIKQKNQEHWKRLNSKIGGVEKKQINSFLKRCNKVK